MDAFVVTGVKTYPLALAQAMEALVREVAETYLGDEVNANSIHDKAVRLEEVLNKWR